MSKTILLNTAILIFSFLSFLKSANAVSAANFLSSYNSTYTVFENQTTKVIQNISLKNLTTDLRATSFDIKLKTQNIYNIKAFDRLGPLKINIAKNNNETNINLIFNDVVAGIGKALNFTLQYETTDIAHKNGLIWEINIPGLPKDKNIDSYAVNLIVPKEVGKALYFSPPPKNGLSWSKEMLEKGGISATFGENQIFNFIIKYHLSNKYPLAKTYEIALPPDTSYQEVLIKDISPAPLNVSLDGDNNWLASYDLKQNQNITVTVKGTAKLFFSPIKKTFLTSEEKISYTKPDLYWEASDPEIINIAASLRGPKEIYDFVVNNLKYNYDKIYQGKVKRLGAKNALNNKNDAICMEFTDLFIALARAKGIPVRELDGFAYTTNPNLRPISKDSDILHAWPEYYDESKKEWKAIDPTWGNTTDGVDFFGKIDLNHFVFVVKGLKSTSPNPAGSYKDKSTGKDLDVKFGALSDFVKIKKTDVKISSPQNIIAGLGGSLDIEINNTGNAIMEVGNLDIASNNLIFENSNKYYIGALPPFSKKKITVKIRSGSIFGNRTANVSININNRKIEKSIIIKPFYLNNTVLIIIGGLIAASVVLIIAKNSRRLSHERQNRENPLYRQGKKP